MFISHAVFLFQKQYLLFKVHCQSFAGMINQNSERSFWCSLYAAATFLSQVNPTWSHRNHNGLWVCASACVLPSFSTFVEIISNSTSVDLESQSHFLQLQNLCHIFDYPSWHTPMTQISQIFKRYECLTADKMKSRKNGLLLQSHFSDCTVAYI